MRLQNKVAIITGGGTGIGKETALKFAKEGAKVVITDINKEAAMTTAQEIQAMGAEAIFVQHNVSSEDDWKMVVSETKSHFGKIDVLFNNAGIYIIKPLTEIELDEWNRLMSINVTGVFLGMKHVIPVMAEQNKGSIINASSIAGLFGAPGHTLYGASKGAVRIMTKDAAIEYAGKGIRVNSIHPGFIETAMTDYASEATGRTTEELNNAYPLGRMGNTAEVAHTVVFLASDESSFTTGTEFVIDGGATAR
ncbi:SDR family NAD(P)-dependent oxidoreductase [Lysinibacillus sp. 38-6]|uniref:SDR family NAD(P)-dependent oxidoreductase n=1 Tax=Lysinibacillus sp. 38-6 TaxID=3385991 RepID=UPI0039088CF8